MLPPDCPEFDYSLHPDCGVILPRTLKQAYSLLRERPPTELLVDTRPIHKLLFQELCPADQRYYAGHYRGEKFRCLESYPVGIRSDLRVGHPPERVSGAMAAFGHSIEVDLAGVDAAHAQPESRLSAADKLIFAVAFACRMFVQFLTIHPYANGNGHVARWMLNVAMWRHGYRVNNFPVEPRPPDPPYTEMIYRYRNGEVEILEGYILKNTSVARPKQ